MRERAVLILAGPDDLSSELVGLRLQERGCRVLQASWVDLALARWWHSPDDESGTTIVLPDGCVLDDADIGVVLNRLDGVFLPQFSQAPAEDRDYAAAEFSALLSSWLNGLEVPVANPPGGENAWAASLHPLGWHALASAHELAVGDFFVASSLRGGACSGLGRVGGSIYPRSSDVAGWYRNPVAAGELRWLWIFGESWYGQVNDDLAARCPAFVQALGLGYAALGFAPSAEGLRLVEVAPRPPLDDEALAGCCADWLHAALATASECTP